MAGSRVPFQLLVIAQLSVNPPFIELKTGYQAALDSRDTLPQTVVGAPNSLYLRHMICPWSTKDSQIPLKSCYGVPICTLYRIRRWKFIFGHVIY